MQIVCGCVAQKSGCWIFIWLAPALWLLAGFVLGDLRVKSTSPFKLPTSFAPISWDIKMCRVYIKLGDISFSATLKFNFFAEHKDAVRKDRSVMVVFLGGCTYTEVAALRFIGKRKGEFSEEITASFTRCLTYF